MAKLTYYTAATLDGFIADPDDSLAWLFAQGGEEPDEVITFQAPVTLGARRALLPRRQQLRPVETHAGIFVATRYEVVDPGNWADG